MHWLQIFEIAGVQLQIFKIAGVQLCKKIKANKQKKKQENQQTGKLPTGLHAV